MGEIIQVEVNKLKFWLENYRFGSAKNEGDAIEKLTNTNNFNALVASIRDRGFQLNNLLTVSKDKAQNDFYLVYDGNRRLAAVKQNPAIKKLQVYEENDPKALSAILSREHQSDPAGRIKWTTVQQARRGLSLFKQGLSENIPNITKCLLLLEQVLREPLDQDFPLTNFERLYNTSGFTEKFGIDVTDYNNYKIKKIDEIKSIYEDINDKLINSRNINTVSNIESYLGSVLKGKPQEERILDLEEDNDSEEQVVDYEEEEPTRLFKPSEFQLLEQYISNNEKFITELKRCPVKRYPHLLSLATRTVLDTLKNIDQNKKPPVALNAGDITGKYMKDDRKDAGNMTPYINTLGSLAHNITGNERTSAHINNKRDVVNKLINLICNSIKKP